MQQMNPNRLTKNDLDGLIPRLLDVEQGEIPCMSATLRRLMALDPDSNASMQELSEIILEDYGLINKVLQVVNSSYYRRLNTEITTVTQAVIFLGFNTIRSIAVDMAILDLLPGDSRGPAAQVMAEAFLAASLAQTVEERSGGNSGEALFVAALYRPMARMVTVLQEPEIYQQLSELERGDDRAGQRMVRDFFRKLGYRIAELWSIPARLAGYMEGCKQFASSVDARQLDLVRGCSSLSRLVLEGDEKNQINEIIRWFGNNHAIDRETLIECIETAASRTRKKSNVIKEVFRGLKVSEMVSAPPVERTEAEGTVPEDEASGPKEESKNDRDELFLDLLNQITQAILEEKFSVDQVLLLAVEIIRRGLDPANIALCLFTPDRKKLVVRYALGEQAGVIKRYISIHSPLEKPPLKAAFQKDVEVMGTWGQLMSEKDSDHWQGLCRNQLCASPIQVRGRPLGCFLVDFAPSRVINSSHMKKIAQVRRLVVISAMKRVGGG